MHCLYECGVSIDGDDGGVSDDGVDGGDGGDVWDVGADGDGMPACAPSIVGEPSIQQANINTTS